MNANHHESLKTVWRLYGKIAVCIAVAYTTLAASTIKSESDKYFAELKDKFNAIAHANQVKETSLTRTDRYFVSVLKKNQPFYSLIKTNSKGVVISEIIRGKTQERDYRPVDNQKWFTTVSQKHEDYHGFLKDENGRYHLFWAKPVFKSQNRFVGAVALKIDLWDCFHKISTSSNAPFLVKLGKKGLYSHKWTQGLATEADMLEVPGVKTLTIHYPAQDKPVETQAVAIADDTTANATMALAPVSETGKKADKGSVKKMTLFQKSILSAMVVAFIILLFYLSRLISLIRDWRLRKKIEKEDNLFSD